MEKEVNVLLNVHDRIERMRYSYTIIRCIKVYFILV